MQATQANCRRSEAGNPDRQTEVLSTIRLMAITLSCYQLVFGDEAHNGKHGGAIFPDSLRWLWRAWKDETP